MLKHQGILGYRINSLSIGSLPSNHKRNVWFVSDLNVLLYLEFPGADIGNQYIFLTDTMEYREITNLPYRLESRLRILRETQILQLFYFS